MRKAVRNSCTGHLFTSILNKKYKKNIIISSLMNSLNKIKEDIFKVVQKKVVNTMLLFQLDIHNKSNAYVEKNFVFNVENRNITQHYVVLLKFGLT